MNTNFHISNCCVVLKVSAFVTILHYNCTSISVFLISFLFKIFHFSLVYMLD